METSEQALAHLDGDGKSMSKVPTDCCKCQSVAFEQQSKQMLSIMKLTVKTPAAA